MWADVPADGPHWLCRYVLGKSPFYTVGKVAGNHSLWLEDTEQRVRSVSPCPTTYTNLAIQISWFYCLPAWHCMYLIDSLTMDLVSLWQKFSVVTIQESKYKKVLETVGVFLPCFYGSAHVGIQLARGVLRASCQAAGCGMTGLSPGSCLQRDPAGTAALVQGISSPLPARKHPPGCCCPWSETHIQTKV